VNQLIPDHLLDQFSGEPEDFPDKAIVIVIRKGDNLYVLGSDFETSLGGTLHQFKRKAREAETLIKQYQFTKETR